eukprot:SM000065S20235  [mRNA]  locus=s65:524138:525341:+ [translate_table: standard]
MPCLCSAVAGLLRWVCGDGGLAGLAREVAECAAKVAVSLRAVARERLEYAFEPLDSFYEHVLAGNSAKLTGEDGECPYEVLGLARAASAAKVRTAYRALAAAHHPDRHAAADQPGAELQFKRVATAYEQIKRAGLASEHDVTSAYASLGGTARNGLSNAIGISGLAKNAKLAPGTQVAVRPLDADIVSRFMAKSSSRQRSTVGA